jgi:hypothetical protein
MNKRLYKGQHGFRPGYLCESQIVTVCQDIADSLDDGARMDATIIDCSKAYSLVPYDRQLMKMAALGMDLRVVVWVRELLSGHSHRVRVGGQLSEEVRVMSWLLQGSVLGPLLFLEYVNAIWRNLESTIKLFADDCVMCRKIMNDIDIDMLQRDLDILREWAVENAIKINPGKSKAVSFMRAWLKDPLNCFLGTKEFWKQTAANM